MSEFSRKMMIARKEAGLNQEELGHAIGKSINTVNRMENGKAETTVDDLVKIAEVTKKPITFFFDYGKEEKETIKKAVYSVLQDLSPLSSPVKDYSDEYSNFIEMFFKLNLNKRKIVTDLIQNLLNE